MILPVTVTVYEPMYDYNEKKYIRVSLPDKVRDYIRELHEHKTDRCFISPETRRPIGR